MTYRDPVCGMEVAEDTKYKLKYKGAHYYFCSAKCLELFKKNPEVYLLSSKREIGTLHSEDHPTSNAKNEETVVLKIGGMHCAGCAQTIEKSIRRLKGVVDVNVSFASEKALVTYDPELINIREIEAAIERAGYKVVYERISLRVSIPMEGDNLAVIRSSLEKLDGIKSLSIRRVKSSELALSIEYNPALISLKDIRDRISSLGFKILEEEFAESEEVLEARKLKRLSVLGLSLTIPIILYSYPEVFSFLPLSGTVVSGYFILILASIVQVVVGGRFYLGAYKAAKMKTANMDTLVSLGTTAAYLFSVWATIPTPRWSMIYYDSAAAVISLVLLGKYFEAKMKGRTSNVVRKLLELQPKRARLIKDGREVEVPADMIQVNDLVIVKPGERIPVDGIIIEGRSAVDESMVTGESIPVDKGPGDEVIGGTMNREGALVIRATKVGADTFLSQVARLMEEALGRKPPMQRLVDRISGVFAFIVMGVAGVTFAIWYLVLGAEIAKALINSVAVLVVACPCALGIATPMAFSLGIGKAAEYGVLIRNPEAVEKMKKLDTIVFDKTGTLTIGEPQVMDIVQLLPTKELSFVAANGGVTSNPIITLAASAEKLSEHPLAKAIVSKAEEMGIDLIPPEEFESIPGRGVRAKINGAEVIVGSLRLMKEESFKLNGAEQEAERLMSEGKTVIALAVNREVIGLIALMDRPRKDAYETIKALKEMGLEVVMLTGDNESTARAIASELGIDRVLANVLPDQKAREIEKLQKEGKCIGMVGDGVNDAPALVQADVGIAMGGGTDIAIEAGDIILMGEDLRGVAAAIQLGKRIMKQVNENLAWAFIYNLALIPLAVAGYLYPIYAGMAMAFSSISVSSWSLLLKRYKPEIVKEK